MKPVNGGENTTYTAQPDETRPIVISGLTAFEKYDVYIYTVNNANSDNKGGGPGEPATPTTNPVQTWPERKHPIYQMQSCFEKKY